MNSPLAPAILSAIILIGCWTINLIAIEPLNELKTAIKLANDGKSAESIKQLDSIVEAEPEFAQAYYWRGREHFRIGKIKESVADFDEFVKLSPKSESSQWERGISYYYAGKFKEGAKQFELYQTYHDQDVENSVWRYLCVAATEGVEKARGNMLPIERDTRVPMMEVFDLYRGKLKPEDIFTAAKAGEPSEAELKHRLFYANLYVGLWYEANSDKEKAKPYIAAAAKDYRISHYMGDVARVHAGRMTNDE